MPAWSPAGPVPKMITSSISSILSSGFSSTTSPHDVMKLPRVHLQRYAGLGVDFTCVFITA
jgi:hypothetical protein